MIPVREALDVFDARRAARLFAEALGFDRRASQEITIVVSELATNILKYGIRGEVLLEAVEDAALGPGLRVIARDEGPEIRDFATAVLDGYDGSGPIDPGHIIGRRGIGAGLGAVVRLSDAVEYVSGDAGKAVCATRYLHTRRRW